MTRMRLYFLMIPIMKINRIISALSIVILVLAALSIVPSPSAQAQFNLEALTEASIDTAIESYSDISMNHPNADAVGYLSARGAIQGYADGTFKVDQAVNRAEALKIILLGGSIDVEASLTTNAFPDVPGSAWYTPFVAKARTMGIIAGNPDGTFRPATTLNLAEALKIVLLAKERDVSTLSASGMIYTDVEAGSWFAPYVLYAKNKNLIEASGNIYPGQPMSRGKLVELMFRLSVVLENNLERFPDDSASSGTDSTDTSSTTGTTGTGGTTGDTDTGTTGSGSTTAGADLEASLKISLSVGNFLFNPNEIRINAGQEAQLQFTSVSGFHDFNIDELGISRQLSTSGTTTIELKVDQPGSYTFYCSVGNHRALGMEGTLIVE